ncbi:cupin domain-containing protein [filamentous cyanobacterium LEGE 11480]|uniref:Cupin domain-containing protein n=1 Tax=Romeriopsis navalis LEGE 11480 TaxID=2777977 RepID=A0A928VMB7_9CYAN|nr:cupin domain-containing protein [Romeriopsis navalis]MBE9031243.1 cupin domain-containing protein [Romeriopsis navalis LEGE 11480]
MKFASLSELPIESVSHNAAIKKQVMLRNGDLPNLTNFAQSRFAPGQVAAAHAHKDMSEVFFVTAGSGNICINGENYRLAVGNCIAIAPNEVHEVSNDGDQDLVLTYFGIRA